MPEKLSWDYDEAAGCEIAMVRGYRIKAEIDTYASNPFEDWDCNWPIIVRSPDRFRTDFTIYDKVKKGDCPSNPLNRFTPAMLVHDQKAIGAAVEVQQSDFESHLDDETPELRAYYTDADFLRSAFDDAIEDLSASRKLAAYAALYEILGIVCLNTSSTGYCQGDYAELLIVATPEAIEEFGRTKPIEESDLEAQAKLYTAWAWGDVYGYVVEKPVFDEDGEIEEWVDACDYNSCWGYYGSDHHESGLEERALECVPDEPVRSPDSVETTMPEMADA
jgi:hypothetical protein